MFSGDGKNFLSLNLHDAITEIQMLKLRKCVEYEIQDDERFVEFDRNDKSKLSKERSNRDEPDF